jgi:hypothetical protein
MSRLETVSPTPDLAKTFRFHPSSKCTAGRRWQLDAQPEQVFMNPSEFRGGDSSLANVII